MKRQSRLFKIVVTTCCLTMFWTTTMFGEDPRDTVREELASNLLKLAHRAQEFCRLPYSQGGGGGTFWGLTADAAGLYKITCRSMPGNTAGVYSIMTSGTMSSIVLKGVGCLAGTNGSPIGVVVSVFPDSVYLYFYN